MNDRIELAIRNLKAGDSRGFEKALETLTASAFAFAKKVCGNQDDAEDIAQETMIRLAPTLENFSDARGLGVWLYKVAKTRCLMSRRKSKFAPAHTLSVDNLIPSPAEKASLAEHPWRVSPEEMVLRSELRRQLERAILTLPEPYRLVLVLRDMEELDTEEAANALGVSPATVKMRLHRARAFVRKQLGDYIGSRHERKGGNHG
jgi:RNA polymerase sigma-70 factor, ECF subfamily